TNSTTSAALSAIRYVETLGYPSGFHLLLTISSYPIEILRLTSPAWMIVCGWGFPRSPLTTRTVQWLPIPSQNGLPRRSTPCVTLPARSRSSSPCSSSTASSSFTTSAPSPGHVAIRSSTRRPWPPRSPPSEFPIATPPSSVDFASHSATRSTTPGATIRSAATPTTCRLPGSTPQSTNLPKRANNRASH